MATVQHRSVHIYERLSQGSRSRRPEHFRLAGREHAHLQRWIDSASAAHLRLLAQFALSDPCQPLSQALNIECRQIG